MPHTWQLQEAKNKLSQVVENALSDGPQIITRRGVEVAVVLSYAKYQKMLGSRKRPSVFFRESPLAGVDVDLIRDKTHARDDVRRGSVL